LEGQWHPKRLVVLEFPSVEQAKRWYDSEEYRPLKAMRFKASKSNLVLVEGGSLGRLLPVTLHPEVCVRRIGLAVVVAISLALTPLAAEAQQAGRVARVGFLNNSAPPPSNEELMKGIAANPFWTAMRELGWMEGQNMVVEHRWGQ